MFAFFRLFYCIFVDIFILSILGIFAVNARISSELALERFEKVGIIVKSALEVRACHRLTGAQHIAGHDQAFFHDVLIDGQARELLEPAAQVELTDIEPACQRIERERIRQVVVDVAQHLIDLLVLGDVVLDRLRRVVIRTAHPHEELDEIRLRERGAAELAAGLNLAHLLAELPQTDQAAVVRADEPVIPQGRIREARGEVLAGKAAQMVEKVVRQPDHEPLIRLSGPHLRPVDVRVAGQQDVARAQLVAPALNDVVHITRDENEYLVERVLVELDGRRCIVVAVMELAVALGHHLPRVENVFQHCVHPPIDGFGEPVYHVFSIAQDSPVFKPLSPSTRAHPLLY